LRFGGDLTQSGRRCLRLLSPAALLSLALLTLGIRDEWPLHAELFSFSINAPLVVGRLSLLVIVQRFSMMPSALGLVVHANRAGNFACLLPRRLDLLDLGFMVRFGRHVDVAVAGWNGVGGFTLALLGLAI